MRLADLDKMEEVAKRCFNEWNLAMAAADGTREINLVYKKQELCKAVLGVAKECEVVDASPVVHAHWEKEYNSAGRLVGYSCSHCKAEIDLNTWDTCANCYCNECGASMKEVKKI